MNVKIESLASEIMKGLEEYSDMATDEVKEEVKKAGSNIRKDIQENALMPCWLLLNLKKKME